MINKLSRNEFMKLGIVATLGLFMPKFVTNQYYILIHRKVPIIDNLGLTIELEERKGKEDVDNG